MDINFRNTALATVWKIYELEGEKRDQGTSKRSDSEILTRHAGLEEDISTEHGEK